MRQILIILLVLTNYFANAQIISTVAGNGMDGFEGDGGPATSAKLNNAYGVATDDSGNLYICDAHNNCIRKVNTAGIITRIAGSGLALGDSTGDGGPAINAQFTMPTGIFVGKHRNIFIADQSNNKIRKIDSNGIITTFAGNGAHAFGGDGGAAIYASLKSPTDVLEDSAGNVYIADQSNARIRKVNTAGIISTIAGTGTPGFSGDGGPATEANLKANAIAMDKQGNLFIGSGSGFRVRKIDTGGIITTVAGDGVQGAGGDGGPAISAHLTIVNGIAVDDTGHLYIADHNNARIRKVNKYSGIINTIAGVDTLCYYSGDGGLALNAQLCGPLRVTIDKNNVLYFTDAGNKRIRRINNPLAVGEVAYLGISIVPNPSNGVFRLSNVPQGCHITICNMLGQKVLELQPTTTEVEVHIPRTPPGIYMLTITGTAGVRNERVVVTGW